MGLFGFGKKKHKDEDVAEPEDKAAETAVEASDDAEEAQPGVFAGRGDTTGPWDVDDENIPDYDEYLDIGSLFLPMIPMQYENAALRLKADRASNAVVGAVITVGNSSLELEAYAAPKTMGLWDDVRADLLEANKEAQEIDGTFGKELLLPVHLQNGTVLTRIVGVDGPRWMLRGIFAGKAAVDGEEQKDVLDEYFTKIVVARGEEPLAPRDMIPMHPPITPAQRRAMAEQAEAGENGEGAAEIPGQPKGPFNSDHQTEVKTTLSRGPMFSEVR
ncbi:DUF3710 domain-containing protein [Bifidobacterium vespertilionis]|uniref:DUF3710 domain-containing protein n=1 Tax=Bifidobacterium vespertilionis TaxID=2562524 RepID=A0A5J5DUJ0_9BIFI|nr:DUF3710 domain-containing protein [Bifidobacterium vespertilionis]KAA8820022.1 DUF3710 domain-containing protein [Bifidobacterium vespertilionis]KAA8823746.1 DUF3710 domain-containing protein [Bifidobacterium vespertilionis]